MSLRFLVVEGNVPEVRERYRTALGRTPAERYGDVLIEIAGGGAFDIICPTDPGATLRKGASLSDYDGVVITGSSLHLWMNEPEGLRQVELARAIYRANVPFFGSCWGIQVAAVAAGGIVHRNPRGREIGYARRITLTEAGARHALHAGRPAMFDAPCSHLDEVAVLPPDSTLLASNAMSQVQAAEFRSEGGTFWGVQYHPEYRHSDICYLIERRTDDLVREGIFTDRAQADAYIADIARLDANPDDASARWRYGLGPDVLDPVQRVCEVRNFIEKRVKPRAMRTAA